MNLCEAELQGDPDGRVFVRIADHRLLVPEQLLAARLRSARASART